MSLADFDYPTRPATSEPNRTKRPTFGAVRRASHARDTGFAQPAVLPPGGPLRCVWQIEDGRLAAVWVR